MSAIDPTTIAIEVLRAFDHRAQIEPFTARNPQLSIASAYEAAEQLHISRILHGERKVGRKIGFTNRSMWPQYGVSTPLWGYMYDTTVFNGGALSRARVSAFSDPRIEPEIAFAFSRSPSPIMTDRQLVDCIEWMSHGYEIVQSPFPDWKFAAADAVAAGGFHGAFYLGEKITVPGNRDEFLKALKNFKITLFRNGEPVESSSGSAVLDSPILAIRHLVELLATDHPRDSSIAPGEIIATGTLTKPYPISAGEIWRTELKGIRLPGKEIQFS